MAIDHVNGDQHRVTLKQADACRPPPHTGVVVAPAPAGQRCPKIGVKYMHARQLKRTQQLEVDGNNFGVHPLAGREARELPSRYEYAKHVP